MIELSPEEVQELIQKYHREYPHKRDAEILELMRHRHYNV